MTWLSSPRPFTGEWMEIMYIRLMAYRRWKQMRAAMPPLEKRKSVMARYSGEKAQQQAYMDRRALIISKLEGLPGTFDLKSLAWDVERYEREHGVELLQAAAAVREAAARASRQYQAALAVETAHQHVWIKRTVDGWACTSCPARGTWSGDDNDPMREVRTA